MPLSEVISWSRDSESYLELLREMNSLREDLLEITLASELRYSTRLLDWLPAESALIASLPNPGPGLGEIRRLFEERLESSSVLKEWWETRIGDAVLDAEGAEILAQLRNLAEELGDEIVI